MSHGLERLNAVQASLASLCEAVAALVRDDNRAAKEHLALANSHLAQAGQLQQVEQH